MTVVGACQTKQRGLTVSGVEQVVVAAASVDELVAMAADRPNFLKHGLNVFLYFNVTSYRTLTRTWNCRTLS